MDKNISKNQLCYTSLAIGYEYNKYAQQLAKDINQLSPSIPIVILTDRQGFFYEEHSVIAVKHKVKSVGVFHDKLCCIEKCLENYDCCVYIDADCRLIKNLAMSRNWKPGITAKTCWDLTKHMVPSNVLHEGKKLDRKALRCRLTYEVAKELQVSVEQCKFVYEGIFAIRKDNGKEVEFLKIWKQIRDYFEFNGVFDGEGVAIGLAASKALLKIHHYNNGYLEEGVEQKIKDVYKDKLFYKLLIHNNSENLSDVVRDKVLKFDQQRRKIAQLPLWLKILKRLFNFLKKKLRLMKIKFKNYHKSKFSEFL